jgi:type IV pilus assembly protein PilW
VLRYAAPWEVGDTTTPKFLKNQYYLRSSLFEGRLFKCSGDGLDGGGDGACTESGGFPIDAPAVRTAELVSHGYFIHAATTSDKCPTAGNIPSLYRMTLVSDSTGTEPKLEAEEIAYGVDDFQVQYGLDTDNDNSVDSFEDAPAAGDAKWNQVIAARIWLLVRAECPETGFTNDSTYDMAGVPYAPGDKYRRQLYTSTVRLRNR